MDQTIDFAKLKTFDVEALIQTVLLLESSSIAEKDDVKKAKQVILDELYSRPIEVTNFAIDLIKELLEEDAEFTKE